MYAKTKAAKLHFVCLFPSSRLNASRDCVPNVSHGGAQAQLFARAQPRDVTLVFKMAAWNPRAYVPTAL